MRRACNRGGGIAVDDRMQTSDDRILATSLVATWSHAGVEVDGMTLTVEPFVWGNQTV